jgi:hypothetical protein
VPGDLDGDLTLTIHELSRLACRRFVAHLSRLACRRFVARRRGIPARPDRCPLRGPVFKKKRR